MANPRTWEFSGLTWRRFGKWSPTMMATTFGNGRQTKVGRYRIRQYASETDRILGHDPFRNEDFWVYGPDKGPLLMIVQPKRLDDALKLLRAENWAAHPARYRLGEHGVQLVEE